MRERDEHVEQGAVELAERTLDSFLAPVQAGDKPLNVSLSIGIAAAQSNRTATDELLRDADVAMYEAKEGGKRRFAVFTPEMRDSIVRRHDLKEELAQAIKHRDLVVQYQPIVDIQTGEAISVLGLPAVPGTGLLAAVVPGAFDGWLTMLQRWGTWSLGDVLEPAIGLARDGAPVLPRASSTIAANAAPAATTGAASARQRGGRAAASTASGGRRFTTPFCRMNHETATAAEPAIIHDIRSSWMPRMKK